ncbi:MAG: hypothetical protein NTV49_06485 [Kiritimatiellaeota bacterium]|nr:hypothetical protein [Kiritimatiellota bacterium]
MIWNGTNAATPPDRAAGLPEDLLATASAALGLPAEVLDAVLQAVIEFGADAGRETVTPAWHMARALWSVGERAAAHAVAAGLLPAGAPDADTRRALEQSAFDPRLGFLLEARVLRPVRWRHQPEDLVWALDFSRLTHDTAGQMALFCLCGLRGMLTAAAGLWDDTAGRGSLALKAWPAPREAEDFCRAFLEHCRSLRGWRATPRVLQLR